MISCGRICAVQVQPRGNMSYSSRSRTLDGSHPATWAVQIIQIRHSPTLPGSRNHRWTVPCVKRFLSPAGEKPTSVRRLDFFSLLLTTHRFILVARVLSYEIYRLWKTFFLKGITTPARRSSSRKKIGASDTWPRRPSSSSGRRYRSSAWRRCLSGPTWPQGWRRRA